MWLGAAVLVAAAVLLPTAAQADPSFYGTPMFGIDLAPGGQLLVADAGQGVVDADTGALVAPLPGVTDVAPIGRGDMLALTSTFAPGAHGALYRVSKGSTRKLADLQDYELQNDPAGDGTDEGSDPYDLARMNGGKTLIADAAGNDLLVADEAGRVDWVASFPTQDGIQAVPTSVAIGPDGAYYVGELTGFPAPLGASRVWRVDPGTRHAHCGSSPSCSVVVSGMTSIIDLAFGPDGKLYVGMGDGGSGGDPENRAQNPNELLGKLLRLDPLGKAAPRIRALGLRNPWRFSFDRKTGDLYIGDVGQETSEEVDYAAASNRALLNFGWRVYEGTTVYQQGGLGPGLLTMPIAQYSHQSGGCTIVGGYVYRGAAVPAARGRYFYGDYCSGAIWSLTVRGGDASPPRSEAFQVSALDSFGEDAAGELYLVSLSGQIYRLRG